MALASARPVADLIHRLASRHASADTPDEELLRRFAVTGDADAFELLLWRHERMVMGVCRRLLRDVHDAEDAFQATFVVLARKARSIAAQNAVTTWLYTVAYRVALNALKQRARRHAHVGTLPDSTEPAAPDEPDPAEIDGLLDEAINSLPTKYREAAVLCLLEGRSHAEAARVLRCPLGTVASRVARAKARLRAWLRRRGITRSDGALAAALGAAGASSASARAAVAQTLQAAQAVLTGGAWQTAVAPQVSALAQRVLTTMVRTRLLKILAIVLTAVVSGGAGCWLWALNAPAAEAAAAPQALAPGQPVPPDKKKERTDAFGEPLPAGAVARLGSLRLYHDAQVQRVVLSPDGKWVVGFDQTGNRLWDAQTGKESPLPGDFLDVWDAKTRSVRRMATFFATADRLVAVKQEKERIVLWDVAAAKEIAKLLLEDDASDEFALSPDGKTLVCSSSGLKRGARHKLVFIDVAKATVRHSVDLAESKSVCPTGIGLLSRGLTFSADGSTLLVHYWANFVDGNWVNGNWVEVRDAQTNTVCYSCGGGDQVSLSPDGTLLAGASRGDKQVRLWDVRATRGAEENRVRIWDVAAGTQRREFGGLSAGGRLLGLGRPNLIFAPDNRTLAVNCDDGTVHLLDVTTGRQSRVLGESQFAQAAGGAGGPGGGPPGSPCLSIAFAPDGRSLAASYDASYNPSYNLWTRVWEVATGRERTRFKGHAGFTMASAYSPDGTLLVTGGTDRTGLVWDLYGLRTADRKIGGFTGAEAERLWADLGDLDAAKAFRAMKLLRANGTPAVTLLNERLHPAPAIDTKNIARLIADLDRDDFAARESATKQLTELDDLAEPALRAVLNDNPSAETRRRVEGLLKRLDAASSPQLLRGVRAVELLESLGSPEARQVLQPLTQGAAEARLTREARAALERGTK